MRIFKLFVEYIYRLGPVNFFNYLYQRFVRKNKVLFVKIPGLKYKVAIRNYSSDIPLFSQMFILQEYNIAIEGKVKTIIDCGANVGLATLFFLLKFPTAKIIAIEPEQNNFIQLTQNVGNYSNVTCLKKGIWNEKTFLSVINTGSGNHAFVVRESKTASENSIEAISIGEIMEEYQLDKIDILKIDIEGSEEQVFESEPAWLKNVQTIFCEIHENMKPGLTQKIKSLLQPDFNFFLNGEYHVFKRKYKIPRE